MRLANNSLSSLIFFYHTELSSIYDNSEIDAILDLALEHFLGFSKTDVITKKNENLNQSDLLNLYFCCKDLKKNKPIQYILKEAWFYDLNFFVDQNVLIPRPETEELVDIILKENKDAESFFDIGTGSGCIAISIKKNHPTGTIYACDISKEALIVAKKNAETQGTNINFIELDILNNIEVDGKLKNTFDVIISNPPYIKFDEKAILTKPVVENEPHLALFVNGQDDILFYKKIIDLCREKLNTNGKLYFELNPLTAEDVLIYANSSNHFKSSEIIKDMSGKMRFLRSIKN
jgi:release factor glutamine methyltransferase